MSYLALAKELAAEIAYRRGGQEDAPLTEPGAGEVVAVMIQSAVLGGELLWLVASAEVLTDHPDIVAAGIPVFFFHEVESLRGKSREQLRVIADTKRAFPTSRIIQ